MRNPNVSIQIRALCSNQCSCQPQPWSQLCQPHILVVSCLGWSRAVHMHTDALLSPSRSYPAWGLTAEKCRLRGLAVYQTQKGHIRSLLHKGIKTQRWWKHCLKPHSSTGTELQTFTSTLFYCLWICIFKVQWCTRLLSKGILFLCEIQISFFSSYIFFLARWFFFSPSFSFGHDFT